MGLVVVCCNSFKITQAEFIYIYILYRHVPLDAGVKGRVFLLLTGLL